MNLSDVVRVDDTIGLAKEIKKGGNVVILFTAPSWCQPCKVFAPHYERAASEVPDTKFLVVDVDDVPDSVVDYRIVSVPTVMLYQDGEYIRNIKAPQGAIPFIRDLEG